jgi:transcriptional regulator with XRE-family HTH domain
MTRNEVQRAELVDPDVLIAASRLRLRALALIDGAMRATKVNRAGLAQRLGVRRSAVQQVMTGTGNLQLQTLAEYLGVLGFELELVPVEAGEVRRSMRERRAPRVAQLTIRDCDFARSGAHAINESTSSMAKPLTSDRARSISTGNQSNARATLRPILLQESRRIA